MDRLAWIVWIAWVTCVVLWVWAACLLLRP